MPASIADVQARLYSAAIGGHFRASPPMKGPIMSRILLVTLVAAGLMLVGVGCSKVTKSNYDKITNGMTQAEVEGIMGKGTEEAGAAGTIGSLTGSGKVVSWKEGDKKITVTFANDKV